MDLVFQIINLESFYKLYRNVSQIDQSKNMYLRI